MKIERCYNTFCCSIRDVGVGSVCECRSRGFMSDNFIAMVIKDVDGDIYLLDLEEGEYYSDIDNYEAVRILDAKLILS